MKSRDHILVIDDEKSVRLSLKYLLHKQYKVHMAAGALEGMFCCAEHKIDVIMMDIRMPGKDGLSALADLKKKHPLVEVVLITAYASLDTVRDAIRFGAFDYLTKPFGRDEVLSVIKRALCKRQQSLEMKKERDILFENQLCLEDKVAEARQNMLSSCESTIMSALLTINARDSYTYDHSHRVSSTAERIAAALGLTAGEIAWIRCAATMHDIGKLGVDEDALKEKKRLTPLQHEEIKHHPAYGARLLSTLPFLKEAVQLVQHHHERYDGKGYPDGLAGYEIPVGARIIAIADAIDAMAHSRYKEASPRLRIRDELEECACGQFDPDIVHLVLKKDLL
jgi:putative nucleotidyltransferase with HDIG domain